MKTPSNLIYGVKEKPPNLVCLISGLQQIAIIAPILVLPILTIRAGGGTLDAATAIVSLSLVALGVGTILQSLAQRWIGSGYLISFCFTNAYYPVSVLAVKLGGLPLLFGMTLFSGAVETLFAPLLRRLRPFFPAEISGICVLLIGLVVGLLGIRQILGIDEIADQSGASSGPEIALGIGTLAVMVGLNVWSKGSLRMYCAIVGILVGLIAGAGMGDFNGTAFSTTALSAGVVALPKWSARLPHFRLDLVIPFAITALACALRAMGDITNAQRINDSDWVRPEMISIRNGLFADGLSTMVSALLGSVGGNTYSASVGLSSATGVTSRQISLWTGGILIALSIFPVAAAAVVSIPRPVIGAALLFNSAFILISGIQIITSRLLDSRKTFTIGLALVLSVSRDVFPGFYRAVPDILQALVSSGFVMGVSAALLLNAIFRIGVRQRVTMKLDAGPVNRDTIERFFTEQGGRWGARRDIISRAIFGVVQVLEVVGDIPEGTEIEASFDEFNLDVRIRYKGTPLIIPGRKPTPREIIASEEGERLLAGYLLRQSADRVSCKTSDSASDVRLHYDH